MRLFLYKHALKRPLGEITEAVRAKRPERLPVVLTQDEVRRVFRRLHGVPWLVACLLYGSGLRVMEGVRLRVKDLEFERRAIIVRDGKGAKDRVVTLPDEVIEPLQTHLAWAGTLHTKDFASRMGEVYLPHALHGKYPNAATEWGWQYAFPARWTSTDPRSGIERRHHINESAVQKAVKQAVRNAGIDKPASCHTLRPSRRICSSAAWTSARFRSSSATRTCAPRRYTHILERGGLAVKSPLGDVIRG